MLYFVFNPMKGTQNSFCSLTWPTFNFLSINEHLVACGENMCELEVKHLPLESEGSLYCNGRDLNLNWVEGNEHLH